MFLALLEVMIQKWQQKQTSNKNLIKQTKNPLTLRVGQEHRVSGWPSCFTGGFPLYSPDACMHTGFVYITCYCWSTSVYPECRGFSSHYFWVTEPLACTFSANHPQLLWDVCKHPLPSQAQTFLLLLWPLHKLTPTECTSVYMCMAIPAVVLGPH